MMKKTLVALAALAAVSTSFAQSSVTISGVLDASVTSFTKSDGINDGIAYTDSQIESSRLLISGNEDLGGGMRAIFMLAGDVQTNNGAQNNAGPWRRGAYVGLVSNSFGEITLGHRGNLLIAANAGVVPTAGNTFTTNISSAIGFADFYTKNAITYVSPRVLGGLVLSGQLGMGNNMIGEDMAGSVTSWSAIYTSGNLNVRAAGQNRMDGASVSSANAAISGAAGNQAAAASGQKNTSMIGLRYKMGAFEIGGGIYDNQTSAGANNPVMTQRTARVVGGSYQLNPTTTLALNFANSESSNLTNAQARYALSKRTSLYGIYGIATNAANTVNAVNFTATATNTGGLQAPNTSGAGANNQGVAGRADTTQSAISFGVIHSF